MSQNYKTIIEDLFPLNRCLMGEGYDSALIYLNHLIPLDIHSLSTGTKLGTWTVPEEWVVRDAWITHNGEKVVDYKDQPLSLVVGSLPFEGKVDREELLKHITTSVEQPDAYVYDYRFYERVWGFTMPREKVYDSEGNVLLPEGEYEVYIDTEYRPGELKYGIHTIKGKTDREILLFAHLDHPYQANDNLSGVAVLVNLVDDIKKQKFDHTVKLIFCPETIGSIAYAFTEDISKVDFVIALDSVGNETAEGILMQRSYDKEARINDCVHLALRGMGEAYRQAIFRSTIGSDEYVFNDPAIGIPGVMLSTHPYHEYHTSKDTPDIISEPMLERVKNVILKSIEYYEHDFAPERNFKAPLFRSGYGIQIPSKSYNLSWDYLIYGMDGRKPLSKLCIDFGLNFEHTLDRLDRLINDGQISCRPPSGEAVQHTPPRKKHAKVSRKTDASMESGEVS